MEVVRSTAFVRWLRRLRDSRGRVRIEARIRRIELEGLLGDTKPLGGGLYEMRFHCGPGYRLYYIRNGETVYAMARRSSSCCAAATRTARRGTLSGHKR